MKAVGSAHPSSCLSTPIVLVVCGALLGAGCDTCNQTQILSTVVGTAVGAGAGYAAGGGTGALIGGLAGTGAGFLVGHLICVEKRRKAAQKAASEARVAQAQDVAKKYQAYNKDLEEYVRSAHNAADEATSGKLTADKAEAARKTVIEETTKASQGAEESAKALQEFTAKVAAEKAGSADEARKQKALKDEQDLIAEEHRLLAQIEELKSLRGQVGG